MGTEGTRRFEAIANDQRVRGFAIPYNARAGIKKL
jgi:hypothetical protein